MQNTEAVPEGAVRIVLRKQAVLSQGWIPALVERRYVQRWNGSTWVDAHKEPLNEEQASSYAECVLRESETEVLVLCPAPGAK